MCKNCEADGFQWKPKEPPAPDAAPPAAAVSPAAPAPPAPMPAAAVEEMPAAAEDREEGGAPEDRDELMVPAAVVEGDALLCHKRKRNQMLDSP